MRKQDTKASGFTLIELLVVISIIGLLSSVVLASMNAARMKARNVARNAEIAQLQTAFELSRSSNNGFPSSGGAWACISTSCYEGWVGYTANTVVDAALTPYMKKPVDPTGGARTAGGFLYIDAGTWYAGQPGPYINWLLEPGALDCGPGGPIYSQNSAYVQCLIAL